MKNIIKNALQIEKKELIKCEIYATKNGYENVDYLLESIIQKPDSFNALLIIDEVGEELETVLKNQFNFPTEIITLRRFKSKSNKVLFEFEPFLNDVSPEVTKVDISEIDTIVVAAKEEGFNDVFLGENAWRSIRINSSMIPKIKYIAAYQVSPIKTLINTFFTLMVRQKRSNQLS